MISDLYAINERLPAGKLFTPGLQHVLMMHAGAALSQEIRDRLFPDAAIEASANVLVNCNLQRLDGPVRGNGNIFQELEGSVALFYRASPD